MAAGPRKLAGIISWPVRRAGVAIVVLLVAAAGCGPAAPPPEKAQRIVSLVPAVTEMLFAIGAGPQVVGVSSYDHFPPEVEALPKVGALLDPDTERILSLRPDLVVVYGSQTEIEARFKKAGIRTFNYRHGVEGAILATLDSITALGAVTGHDAQAREVVTRISVQARGGTHARRGARTAAHAARDGPPAGHAAGHLRRRGRRLPARDARRSRRRQRFRRHQAAVGPALQRNPAGAGAGRAARTSRTSARGRLSGRGPGRLGHAGVGSRRAQPTGVLRWSATSWWSPAHGLPRAPKPWRGCCTPRRSNEDPAVVELRQGQRLGAPRAAPDAPRRGRRACSRPSTSRCSAWRCTPCGATCSRRRRTRPDCRFASCRFRDPCSNEEYESPHAALRRRGGRRGLHARGLRRPLSRGRAALS